MTYQPNFNDPRVIARCKKALGFACGVMSETKPHAWSTRYLDKHFGISSNSLSKYLRNTLLICTDEFFRFNQLDPKKNKCKEYILNKEGVRFLQEALKISNTSLYPIVLQVANDHTQALKTGNFPYKDQSNRLWHPLQRYRKQHRTQILAEDGYIHDYDIQCAAPTLLHQYAQQLGMDQWLFAIRRYLTDRTAVRLELAQKLELEPAAVKEIINALFAGARIANHKDSDIYKILDGDQARIEFLKQDAFITELRSDIKTCWEYITPTMPRKRKTSTNRLIKISCKEKWNIYFELERRVLDSIRTYLDENSNKCFLMHDGWACEREVDRNELNEYVRNQTGFDVKFDYDKK